jgi:hypothetical protein
MEYNIIAMEENAFFRPEGVMGEDGSLGWLQSTNRKLTQHLQILIRPLCFFHPNHEIRYLLRL